MEEYNAPKDLGYRVKSDSDRYKTIQVQQQTNYGGEQRVSSSLPIYNQKQEPNLQKTSQCPRGADLGNKASRCGAACSGACLVPT